jgi:polar amino acid transport system permease protein
MIEFSLWDILRNLLLATRWTLVLSVIAILGGGLIGFVLLILRLLQIKPLCVLISLYVELFQGTPLLMQLFLFYFGLALFGIDTSVWISASAALILYAAAYLTEIWSGCIRAVPKGQSLAAKSLGLDFIQELKYIIFPQAYKLSIAPTVGFLVQLIKGTAITSVIGFVELTKSASMISNVTFKPFLVFSSVALIYFVICFPISWLATKIESKISLNTLAS